MNTRKRKLISKRHIRRIVANQTAIDIAGSSRETLEWHTINTSSKQTNVELCKIPDEEVSSCNTNSINDDTINIHVKDTISDLNNDNDNDDNNISDKSVINDEVHRSNNDEELNEALATWAVGHNISRTACNALLKILKQHTLHNLPADARTLLKTPKETHHISKMCEGEYLYFGLDNIIQKMLLKDNNAYVNLLINIDGLPLAKSSQASLWTILCSNTVNKTVYLVGAYFGYKKPTDSNVFLQSLVDDLINFTNNGYIYNENIIKIRLFGLICDAPAKSFVLCVKGHTGFYSCTKCVIKGKYINGRVCFPYKKTFSSRKDELFSANAYQDFQIEYSILNNIPGFLPINNTPLDYMHLICLGVVKKIILLWIKGPLYVRLSSRSINKISHLLILLKNTTPNDFVRKPRSLKDVKQWKAVEFRNFLLYTGPIILRHILKQDIYLHFLTLHIAITILIRSNLNEELINFAESLLHHFVTSFEILYGKQYMSHNIHNLLHICSDVRTYGSLDNFSAFRFENYMASIKKRLRKNEKPLQQLYKRYNEIENCNSFLSNINNQTLNLYKYLHNNGPVPDNCDIQAQYLMMSNEKFNINCKGQNNNCCLLKSGQYVLILNIVQKNEDFFLIGKKFKYIKDVYELPYKSSTFNIKVMTINNDSIFSWPITDLLGKAWKIPFENHPNTFAIFSLNHTI